MPNSSVPDRSFKGFLFDMDGTLLDSTAVVERLWGKWAIRHGLDPETFIPTIYGIRAIDVITRLDLEDINPMEEATRIEALELEDLEGIVPIGGAIAFLKSLPREKWAIVTSAPIELARRRMAVAGISMPDIVISGEDVAFGKPHPACYQLGAQKLGLHPANCLVFEDAPAGISAGKAAGSDVIMITATHHHAMHTANFSMHNYIGAEVRIVEDGCLRIVVGLGTQLDK